jgi:hypothetical protein
MIAPDKETIVRFILFYRPALKKEELMIWRLEALVMFKVEIELELARQNRNGTPPGTP